MIFITTIYILTSINLFLFSIQLSYSIYKYFLLQEIHLSQKYGQASYIAITGASTGQGKDFAFQFAKRGFNLLLIGSHNTYKTKNEINKLYPTTIIKIIEVDFTNAHQQNFFDIIEDTFQQLDISILINNVAFRFAWNPYHEMPRNKINDVIICGTIVQSQLTRLIIPKFLKRKKKSAILFMTAQCIYSNYFINFYTNLLTLPFVSVYEASNIYGYAHACSIYEEYKDVIDILHITPGAVITDNTKYFLNSAPFKIKSYDFINNIMKLIGNINGTTCGCWQHALSLFIISIFPCIKKPILKKIGISIANYYTHFY